MTLNNFEKQAKERLNKREITPTDRAWKEISAALEANNDNPRTNYFWYGIAAGFIGLLIVSVVYFSAASPEVLDSQVAADPVDSHDIEQLEIIKDQEASIPDVLRIKEQEVVSTKGGETEKERSANPQKFTSITVVDRQSDKEINPKVIPIDSEKIIDAKLQQLIAKVNLLERDQNDLTDAEVDSLLWQAQSEIFAAQLLREDNTVDATALLSEVEDELDQSFRDQIFEKLKTGFNKVRTAVADRNN